MSLGALEPRFWQGFCRGLGRVDLIRSQFDPCTVEPVAAIFRSRARAEWIAFSQDADVCLEPLLTIEYALNHPQVQARGLATGDGRRVPQLGEDTASVLQEVGYAVDEIEELRAAGVVSWDSG